MFADNNLLMDSVMIDNQVLLNYIIENLGGVVDGDYADPYGQGRITIVGGWSADSSGVLIKTNKAFARRKRASAIYANHYLIAPG